ncbi:MAG: hypothetical protein FLDDKLPJ_03268 [Phycisphaerae bacterium]|nr:hypothetical protein [Phycisphaerae bacterium]
MGIADNLTLAKWTASKRVNNRPEDTTQRPRRRARDRLPAVDLVVMVLVANVVFIVVSRVDKPKIVNQALRVGDRAGTTAGKRTTTRSCFTLAGSGRRQPATRIRLGECCAPPCTEQDGHSEHHRAMSLCRKRHDETSSCVRIKRTHSQKGREGKGREGKGRDHAIPKPHPVRRPSPTPMPIIYRVTLGPSRKFSGFFFHAADIAPPGGRAAGGSIAVVAYCLLPVAFA